MAFHGDSTGIGREEGGGWRKGVVRILNYEHPHFV